MLATINLVGSLSDGYLIAKCYIIVAHKKRALSGNSVSTSDHVVLFDLPNNEGLSFTPDYPSALHYPDTRVPVTEVTILLMIAERRYHTSIFASLLSSTATPDSARIVSAHRMPQSLFRRQGEIAQDEQSHDSQNCPREQGLHLIMLMWKTYSTGCFNLTFPTSGGWSIVCI
jgi:hypothetical protein